MRFESIAFVAWFSLFQLSELGLANEICQASAPADQSTLLLVTAVAVHRDLAPEMAELQKILQEFEKSGTEPSVPGILQQIIGRLSEARINFQEALAHLDSPDAGLLVAQGRARLVAALSKFRILKALNLDEAKQLQCIENRLDILLKRFPQIAN